MYIWGRSWLYRLWAVGGFVAVIAVTVSSAVSADPGDDRPMRVGAVAVGIYLVGLMLLTLLRMTADRRQGTFGLPVDLVGGQALTDETWRFAFGGFAMICAVTLAVVVDGVLYATDAVDGTWEPFGASGIALPYAFAPVAVLALIALVRLPGQLSRGRELGDRWLEPLGLHIEAMPRSVILPDATGDPHHHLVGATRYVGVRHGRRVQVDVTAGGSTLLLEGGFAEPFEIVGKDGVLRGVGGIPPNPAWDRITVTGGSGGIAIERRGGQGRGWLADLWLAEQLQHQKGARTG